jgi:ribosomal protein S1
MWLKKHLALAVLLVSGAPLVFADTIQLKDQDAVTGKILAQKSDSVVVDVGYTVLIIPRSVITRIVHGQ